MSKENYLPPCIEIMLVEHEGVMAASGGLDEYPGHPLFSENHSNHENDPADLFTHPFTA